MESGEHERLQGEVAAHAAARLHGEARERLERHLLTCAECAEMLAVAREVASTVRSAGPALGSPHPSVPELRAYATLGPAAASATLEAHVAWCASCTLEVAAWRRAAPAPGATAAARARSFRSAAWPVATAASLAAGVLVGLWLAPLRERHAAGENDVAAPAPWIGPVEVLRVEDVPRGEGGPAEVVIRAGQAQMPLAVELETLDEADLAPLEVRITRADGTLVWSAEAREAAREGARVRLTFLVPTALLKAAETYRATVVRRAAPDEALLQRRFVVRPPVAPD